MHVPAVGDVLAGKYAVEAIVGRGGMGVVLAARHLELDERVAIKLILAEASAQGAEFTARFVREAKLASKIKSEHVVRVIDVARLESGEPYIVMELLEGHDLAELLGRHGPMPLAQASLYVLQACEALAEAHALGIVHRDLKPANLFLTTRRDGSPCVKVLDFGISKLMGEGQAQSMTKTNALMGSPLYMSPDQLVQSRDVDARSDVWAIGVSLFELTTGQCPFQAEEAPQLIAHILSTPAPALRTLRPDAPAGLEAVVAGALTKDRTQRTPDIATFAAALAPFAGPAGQYTLDRIVGLLSRSGRLSASHLPSTASGAWTASSHTPGSGHSGTASGSSLDLAATRRPSRALPALLLLGGVLAAAGVAFWLLRAPVAPPLSEPLAATSATASSAAPPAEPLLAPSPSLEPAPSPALAAPSAEASAVAATRASVAPIPQAKRAAAKPVAAPASAPPRPAKSNPAPAADDPFGGVR